MKKVILLLFVLLLPGITAAQCAMCRAVLESGEGETMAKGINDGIIYLMAVPYLVVFVIGYIVYRKIKS